MRRESSTVVVLVGEVTEGLLSELGRSVNVSVARAPAAGDGQPGAGQAAAARPGWEAGALALREAARRQSAYVIVPEDPLAELADAWRAMWDVLRRRPDRDAASRVYLSLTTAAVVALTVRLIPAARSVTTGLHFPSQAVSRVIEAPPMVALVPLASPGCPPASVITCASRPARPGGMIVTAASPALAPCALLMIVT
jgi:hypothetical protein